MKTSSHTLLVFCGVWVGIYIGSTYCGNKREVDSSELHNNEIAFAKEQAGLALWKADLQVQNVKINEERKMVDVERHQLAADAKAAAAAAAVVAAAHAAAAAAAAAIPTAADIRAGPGGEVGRRAMESRLTSLQTVNEKTLPIGYVKIPTLPKSVPNGSPLAGESAADDGHLHIIFSSGCNVAQHWESEMTMATAALVGQRGRITRIVSGCHESSGAQESHKKRYHTSPAGKNDAIVPLDIMNRSANPDFGLYLTPPFEGAKEFPWINKPTSIAYFMKHARPELDRMGETIIAVIDPDFLFLKSLTMVGKPKSEMALARNFKWPSDKSFPVDVPEKGRPVSQRYGIESGWMHKFKLDQIVSPGSRALNWKSRQDSQDAAKYHSVGPPMIHHIDDLENLAPLWAKFMSGVLLQEKDILADMWAYSMASAELDLNHTTVIHHMLSSPNGEGDANFNKHLDTWVGKVALTCSDPIGSRAASANVAQLPLPTFLHYASNFRAPKFGYPDEWMFHKGHIPSNILDCSTPYIIVAPDDTWEQSPDECRSKTPGGNMVCKISALAVCLAVQKINQVLKVYKTKFCPEYETRHLIRLVQQRTRDMQCKSWGDEADFWCWPLAQIEGLPDDWRKKGFGPVLVANPEWQGN